MNKNGFAGIVALAACALVFASLGFAARGASGRTNADSVADRTSGVFVTSSADGQTVHVWRVVAEQKDDATTTMTHVEYLGSGTVEAGMTRSWATIVKGETLDKNSHRVETQIYPNLGFPTPTK